MREREGQAGEQVNRQAYLRFSWVWERQRGETKIQRDKEAQKQRDIETEMTIRIPSKAGPLNQLIIIFHSCFSSFHYPDYSKTMKVAILCLVLLCALTLSEGRANGDSCSRDRQCDSGHCCGVPLLKKCRECCQDGDCDSNRVIF